MMRLDCKKERDIAGYEGEYQIRSGFARELFCHPSDKLVMVLPREVLIDKDRFAALAEWRQFVPIEIL